MKNIKKSLILTLLFLFSVSSVYAIDYSSYDLTELQISILNKLEAKGHSEEKLLEFAASFHRHNNKVEQVIHIPPYTEQELVDTEKWAGGGAFSVYAKFADVTFDRDEYVKNCPNWAIFGFLKATGKEHVNYDIMKTFINVMFELDYWYKKDPEGFRQKYLELAVERGFSQYITQ